MGHGTVCVPVFPALRRLRQENHEFNCGQLGLHSETLSEVTYMGLEYEYPQVLSGNYKGIFKINTLEGKPF